MSFDGEFQQMIGTPAQTQSSAKLSTSIIDSVGVSVEAYLGETCMTVAELNALRVGESISLNAPLNQVVELRVNGVAIAHGELVAIGDEFGVRIVAVAAP